MHHFSAILDIIGVNPFVFVPPEILEQLFRSAGRDKGPVPVRGSINGKLYRQHLVRYSGEWRLYINTGMLPHSPRRVGEQIQVEIAYDPESRELEPPPAFTAALEQHAEAKAVFDSMPPSRQLELVRYLARLKSEEALQRNVQRAIRFLLGEQRFVGRSKP